jgi:hypothetical protein
MSRRRWWTGRELMLARHYAAEGLSIGRTAPLIGRTRKPICGAAAYATRSSSRRVRCAPIRQQQPYLGKAARRRRVIAPQNATREARLRRHRERERKRIP